MYTYMNKRKASDRAVSPTKGPAPNARNAISSRSELLHLSGAGVRGDAHRGLQRLLGRDGPLVESHGCPLLGPLFVNGYCSRLRAG